jgi:hypothetical protein
MRVRKDHVGYRFCGRAKQEFAQANFVRCFILEAEKFVLHCVAVTLMFIIPYDAHAQIDSSRVVTESGYAVVKNLPHHSNNLAYVIRFTGFKDRTAADDPRRGSIQFAETEGSRQITPAGVLFTFFDQEANPMNLSANDLSRYIELQRQVVEAMRINRNVTQTLKPFGEKVRLIHDKLISGQVMVGGKWLETIDQFRHQAAQVREAISRVESAADLQNSREALYALERYREGVDKSHQTELDSTLSAIQLLAEKKGEKFRVEEEKRMRLDRVEKIVAALSEREFRNLEQWKDLLDKLEANIGNPDTGSSLNALVERERDQVAMLDRVSQFVDQLDKAQTAFFLRADAQFPEKSSLPPHDAKLAADYGRLSPMRAQLRGLDVEMLTAPIDGQIEVITGRAEAYSSISSVVNSGSFAPLLEADTLSAVSSLLDQMTVLKGFVVARLKQYQALVREGQDAAKVGNRARAIELYREAYMIAPNDKLASLIAHLVEDTLGI